MPDSIWCERLFIRSAKNKCGILGILLRADNMTDQSRRIFGPTLLSNNAWHRVLTSVWWVWGWDWDQSNSEQSQEGSAWSKRLNGRTSHSWHGVLPLLLQYYYWYFFSAQCAVLAVLWLCTKHASISHTGSMNHATIFHHCCCVLSFLH